jgi:hypothetical protein
MIHGDCDTDDDYS